MGTLVNQIATEANTERSYGTYISSTTTNKKCITVKRLLKGLLETGNTPTYNTTNNTYNTTYQIKTWAASMTSSVNLRAGYATPINGDSQIINGNATNYGSYPFSTGTGFLAIKTDYTINATLTVTCVQLVNPTGDDGVSPASMDFDNPEEDTESNTSGQEPNVTGNARLTIDGCNNQGTGVTGCTCNTPITANTSCPRYGASCLRDGVSGCSPDNITTKPNAVSITLSLQIYTGTVDDEDKYATLCSAEKLVELSINSNTSTSITLNIPTSKVFTIAGPPTGMFKFRLIMAGVGLGTQGSVGVSAKITATVPYIAFTVYNPGPKCIKYSDLQYVYPLYGK